jgi:hypothetical protein
MVIKKKTGTQGFRRSVTTMIKYNFNFGHLVIVLSKFNTSYQMIYEDGKILYFDDQLLSKIWTLSFDLDSEMTIDSCTPLTLLVKEWL